MCWCWPGDLDPVAPGSGGQPPALEISAWYTYLLADFAPCVMLEKSNF